jgi:hypothetical protein
VTGLFGHPSPTNWPDFKQVSDLFAEWADHLTGGATAQLREAGGYEDAVDHNSKGAQLGGVIGDVHLLAFDLISLGGLLKGGVGLIRRGEGSLAECLGVGCFAAGTPVRTPDGDKAIEDVRPGNVVLARAEDDPAAPVQARVVEDVFRRQVPVLGLVIGGQTLRLTAEHPFHTLTRGWTRAGDLRAGDWVLGEKGEWLPIGKVEPAGDPVVVYNMCVAGAHTFFVGKERWGFAVWVHNAPGPLPCPKKTLPSQDHHFATNKNKTYTPQMEDLAGRYGLDLDEIWNRELLPHLGRHPDEYHEFVLEGMKRAAREAGNDVNKFLKLFEKYVKAPVRQNPDLLRKDGWTR